MTQKIKSLFLKYKETISYIFFGVATTLVDYAAYILLTSSLVAMNEGWANVLSQAIAILFAFFVNKLFVFEDRSMKLKTFVIQFVEFVSMRLITLGLNSLLFWLLIEKLSMNDLIIKAIVSVIVIILNYIFSKLIIFRKKKDKDHE